MRSSITVCLLIFFGALSVPLMAQSTDNRTEFEAAQVADSLYLQLAKGAEFGSLVSKYSEDPGSNKEGGRYMNVEFGSFVPEFEATVWQLKENEISKPFRTEYGYHIVQLIAKTERAFSVRHILIRFQ